MRFRVEVETRGREVYFIEADDPKDAEEMFNFQVNCPEPSISEVLEADVTSIDEEPFDETP